LTTELPLTVTVPFVPIVAAVPLELVTLVELAKALGTNRRPTTVFPIDAVFMPVLRVNYLIQSDEDVLDFPLHNNSLEVSERVVFEIWTNGNVTPREAMHQASTQLVRLFSLFQKSSTPSMLYRPRLFKERIRILKEIVKRPNYHHTLQTIYPNHFLAVRHRHFTGLAEPLC